MAEETACIPFHFYDPPYNTVNRLPSVECWYIDLIPLYMVYYTATYTGYAPYWETSRLRIKSLPDDAPVLSTNQLRVVASDSLSGAASLYGETDMAAVGNLWGFSRPLRFHL